MRAAMQAHIAKHAVSYAIGMMLGLGSAFVAVYDNFWPLEPEAAAKIGWWQWLALFSKCAAAFCLSVVGYLLKSPVEKDQPKDSAP